MPLRWSYVVTEEVLVVLQRFLVTTSGGALRSFLVTKEEEVNEEVLWVIEEVLVVTEEVLVVTDSEVLGVDAEVLMRMRFYRSCFIGVHTDLYSCFRQPGHRDEEFLLQVESSKMNQQEGDKKADHQTNTDTGQT